MIASDIDNKNFVGAMNPDDLLTVTFYTHRQENTFESKKQNRAIFFDVVYVRIITPGNNLNIIEIPARQEHKLRFPRQYAIFTNSQVGTEQMFGTPLEQWTEITRAQVEELKHQKFRSVEQIASASDHQVQQIGMNGNLLKQKAISFLGRSKSSEDSEEMKKKEAEIQALKDQVKILSDLVEGIIKKPPTETQIEQSSKVENVEQPEVKEKEDSAEQPRQKRKYTKKLKATEEQPLRAE